MFHCSLIKLMLNVYYKSIDWEYSSNLSLMSISSYVEYETGNIYRISEQAQVSFRSLSKQDNSS